MSSRISELLWKNFSNDSYLGVFPGGDQLTQMKPLKGKELYLHPEWSIEIRGKITPKIANGYRKISLVLGAEIKACEKPDRPEYYKKMQ